MTGAPRRVILSHTSELSAFPSSGSFVRAAETAVSRAGDAIVEMTYFTARDDSPAAYCEKMVQGCEVYAGLIGLRYGSPVRDRPEVSYTELEFEAATKAGLPRLVFMLDEDAVLPIPLAQALDRDPDLQARQRAFRDRLLNAGITVAKVASPEQLELLLYQAIKESQPAPVAAAAGYAVGVPAAGILAGRDAELAALVRAWLTVPPPPMAALGAPGIGKSAICLKALHEERVEKRFVDRRWFFRCDGILTARDLLSMLAAELGVNSDEWQGSALLGHVQAELVASPAVVVLDNFEDPWTADPVAVEELLRTLAATGQTAITISTRGISRPAGLAWGELIIPSPLQLLDARRMFLGVAGPEFAADPDLDGLLSELDGMPLAVELMGYAAQGQPDLREVAGRWQQERSRMLERMGGGSRVLSVAVSVEASVSSPLMTPPARQLLTLLGVLPDGVTRDDVAALLPSTGLGAAARLRQLGLAFDEGTRLRLLAPIREYIADGHPPAASDRARVEKFREQQTAGGAQ